VVHVTTALVTRLKPIVFAGWLRIGGPNPRGLGYLSKSIEIVLVLALLVHIWTLVRRPRSLTTASV
jgi:hypothetical protein